MIKYISSTAIIALTLVLLTGCESTEDDSTNVKETTPIEAKVNEEAEAYLDGIDTNDSLSIGNSLFYSKGEGPTAESVEVVVYMNDSSEVLKMEERILEKGSNTVTRNVFYFKKGKKYATDQFFIEGKADSAYFVQLRSYYDDKEKVKASKRRTAIYEDLLFQEPFVMVDKIDCSTKRAIQILNQEGPFKTTYQGYVENGGFLYLVVGENKPDGFNTALVVQQVTPLIMELKSNSKAMMGTPLEVQYETVYDGTGSVQILHGVKKK